MLNSSIPPLLQNAFNGTLNRSDFNFMLQPRTAKDLVDATTTRSESPALAKFNNDTFNIDIDKAMGIASGVANLATTAGQQIMDIFASGKSQLTLPKYTNFHANNINDVSDFNNIRPTSLNASTMLHKPSAGETAVDFGSKIAQGAAAGKSLGPWGELAGGIVGGLTATGNAITKNITYKNDLQRLKHWNRVENNNALIAQNEALGNINKKQNTAMYAQRLTGNYNAEGGRLDSNEQFDVTTFNVGGSHETNPNGGIPQGIGDNGQPNLVEEGEVKWNNFIFSKRIKPDDNTLQKFNTMFNKRFDSYADAAKFILDLHEERENSPFDKSALNVQMQRLADAQEYQKVAEEAAQYSMSPEEYMQYQQQVQQIQQQNQHANTFAAGGPKGKSHYYFKGSRDRWENNWNENQYAYVRPPGAGVDGAGIIGPNRDTKRFAKSFQKIAYHLSDLSKLDYMFTIGYRAIENAQSPEIAGVEMSALMKNVLPTYNEKLKVAQHILARLAAYDSKYGTKYASQAKSYLRDIMPHAQTYFDTWFDNSVQNKQLQSFYNNELQQHLGTFLQNWNSPNQWTNADYYMWGPGRNQTNAYLYQVNPDDIFASNTNNTSDSKTPASRRTTGNVAARPAARVTTGTRYWDPSAKNVNGTQGAYVSQPTATTYTITGTGAGVGNQRYDGNFDYVANPHYTNKMLSLGDGDWEAIMDQLKKTNPAYYADKDINWFKKAARDGKFGNVHRAVLGYQPVAQEADYADIVNDLEIEQADDENKNLDVDTNVASDDKDENDSDDEDENKDKNDDTKRSYPYGSILRAAPALNNLRVVLEQDAPDYTYANQLASTYRPITSYPVGQYQRYQPVDQHYLDTQANQRANTQYEFYKNNVQSAAAANAYATIAAANQNAAVHDAYIKALQTNNQNRNSVLQYNNQIDMANENVRRQTQATNNSNYANIMGNAYAAAEQERTSVENARETNLQNLATNLGNIGRELYDRWRIEKDPTNSYDANMNYLGRIPYFWNPTTKQFEP